MYRNSGQVRQSRKKINPDGSASRFAGTKLDVLTGGAMIRWLDYSRARKDDLQIGKRVDDQHTVNLGHATRLSWTRAASFEDNDLGASRQAKARKVVRKDFNRLVEYIKLG